MSDAAFRLWRRLAPERTLYYRFFNRRKLVLPKGLTEATLALGDQRYDPDRRRGVLFASPLEFGDGPEHPPPVKLAVVFVADARAGILELERAFRERFER